MPPLPEPGPTPERCPNCGAPLPQPKPSLCPNCGAGLRARPVWLSVIAALGAALLIPVGLVLGAIGACLAEIQPSISAPGSNNNTTIAAFVFGGVLCLVVAFLVIRWLVKKPKA